jgi:hypothetical protein
LVVDGLPEGESSWSPQLKNYVAEKRKQVGLD